MKVVLITNGLKTGGSEMMLYKMLSRLDRGRIQPEVINIRPPGAVQGFIESLGVPVLSLGWQSLSGAIAGLPRLAQLIRNSHADLIHSWTYYGNIGAALAVRWLGASSPPLIWGIRATLTDLSFEKPPTRWLIRQSRRLSTIPQLILYDSEAGRRQHEALGYPSPRGRVIPNGIDFDVWRADPEARRQVRSELGVGPEDFLIGMIGRVHPSKDHPTFLSAAEQFLDRRPNAHFLLAGLGTERLHRSARLHLLGHRSDVGRLMAALDLLSCASRTESFPNVVLEALASGVLSVVSDVGDAARLVPDERFVVPPMKPAALAEAWERIASLSIAERETLACDFRRAAMEQYSIAVIAAKYQSIYEEVTGTTKTRSHKESRH
jgi:glycosyltransferase involved in cell wall biosynthesis